MMPTINVGDMIYHRNHCRLYTVTALLPDNGYFTLSVAGGFDTCKDYVLYVVKGTNLARKLYGCYRS